MSDIAIEVYPQLFVIVQAGTDLTGCSESSIWLKVSSAAATLRTHSFARR